MFLLLELGKELGLHSSMNMSHLKCEQLFKTILGYIPEYIGKQKKRLLSKVKLCRGTSLIRAPQIIAISWLRNYVHICYMHRMML